MMRGNKPAMQDAISYLLFVLIVFLCQCCVYFNISWRMYMFKLTFCTNRCYHTQYNKLSKKQIF